MSDSLLLMGSIKCKKCKRRVYKQEVYLTWHNVDCFESVTIFGFSITWVKNWWVCNNHDIKGDYRFHDIDGRNYFIGKTK
jgi:hypothetical protein